MSQGALPTANGSLPVSNTVTPAEAAAKVEPAAMAPTTHSSAARQSSDKLHPPVPEDASAAMGKSEPSSSTGRVTVRRSLSSNIGRGLLKRLASQSSSHSKEDGESASAARTDAVPSRRSSSITRRTSQSSSSSMSHRRLTKAELAELSKPRGKYKSGVRWDEYNVPEPFMEVSEAAAVEGTAALNEGLIANAMLSSASTAAARSYLENSSLAEPIFDRAQGADAASRDAASSTEANGVPSVAQTLAAVTQSGVTAGILSEGDSPAGLSRQSSPRDDIDGTAKKPSGAARGSPDQQMLSEAAQRVLEAARKQAREVKSKKGLSVPASPKSQTPPKMSSGKDADATRTEAKAADGAASPSTADVSSKSKEGRGKSFMGTIKGKSKLSRSRRNSLTGQGDASSRDASAPGSPDTSSNSLSGTTGRRRRYNDTRDLDLLAYELAAEALVNGMPEPPFARASRSGASSPRSYGHGSASGDGRRRSYHSVGGSSDHGFNTSQTSLANLMMQPMTQINPMQRSREPSFSNHAASLNGTPANSVPASPRMVPGDVLRPDAKQFVAGSPYLQQAATMMPSDMLTGLGGSPYPSLTKKPRATGDIIDNLDPFGIPLSHESPFDATSAYVNRTNVYHTPTQVAHARSQAASAGGRRSVLQMKMHDPETELQGLTKMPKGKRLTPFGSRSGSRASSRAPSPSASYANLKEAVASQQASAAAADAAAMAPEVLPLRRPSESTAERPKLEVTLPPETRATLSAGSGNAEPSESDSQTATPRAETFPSPLPMAAPAAIKEQDPAAPAAMQGERGAAKMPSKSSSSTLASPSPRKNADSKPAAAAMTLPLPTSKSAKRLSAIFGMGKKRSNVEDGTQNSLAPTEQSRATHSSKDTAAPSVYPARHTSSSGCEGEGNMAGANPPKAPAPVAEPQVPSTKIAWSATSALAASRTSLVSTEPATESSRASKSSSRSTAAESKKSTTKPTGSTASVRPGSAGGGNIRRFLRRLSSFGASSLSVNEGGELKNSAKANFPDDSTMPKFDREKLIKAGIISPDDTPAAKQPLVEVPGRRASLAMNDGTSEQAPTSNGTSTAPSFKTAETAVPSRGVAAGSLLDTRDVAAESTTQSINPEMAKNGFGTRSALIYTTPPDEEAQPSLLTEHTSALRPPTDRAFRSAERSPASTRSDSRTPSSEESAFPGNGGDTFLAAGPDGCASGSGSEEVVTPASSAPSLSAAPALLVDTMHLKQPSAPAPPAIDTY